MHAPLKEFYLKNKNRGLKLRLRDDKSTMLVLKEVVANGVYAPVQLSSLRPLAILDIGANQGITSGYFRLLFPEAKIVAVEPDPASFPILLENASSISNCTTYNLALLDSNRIASFKSSKISVVSTLYDLPNATIDNEVVNVYTRHAGEFYEEASVRICEKGFDFLKIDTEGAEVPILYAIGERLSHIQTIFLEFHSFEDRRAIEKILKTSHDIRREVLDSQERGTLAFVRRV